MDNSRSRKHSTSSKVTRFFNFDPELPLFGARASFFSASLCLCGALLLLLFSFVEIHSQKPIEDLKPTVILISLDGFRYDYLEKYQPKTLNLLARKGVRAKWMTPSFPSKTFPNHYTIVTGLYPAHNGIVENTIYDKSLNATFAINKREEIENSRWWLGEPIWVTAQKQGQIAASFFWVGSEAEIQGIRPTFWKTYEHKLPNEQRVDAVLSWLDLPKEKRPTMITMYFSDTDDAGHDFSPESPEVKTAVQRVDAAIARLYEGLKKRKVSKKVNLIVVSDHGMATANPNNAVLLDKYFNFDLAEQTTWSGEIVGIFPKAGSDGEWNRALNAKPIEHAKCWRKADIPERFHYRDSERIAPIVCSPDEGWMLTTSKRFEDYKKRNDMTKMRGAHGYDNELASMRAIFLAHGNAFRKQRVVEPFQNIEVYNVMCRILGLTPASNDGSMKLANQILRR